MDVTGVGAGAEVAAAGLPAAGLDKVVRTIATTAMTAITAAAPTIASPVRLCDCRTTDGIVSPR